MSDLSELINLLRQAELEGQSQRAEETRQVNEKFLELFEGLLEASLHQKATLDAGTSEEIASAAMAAMIGKAEQFVFSAMGSESNVRFRLLVYFLATFGARASLIVCEMSRENRTPQELIRAFRVYMSRSLEQS